jgi:gas vesicle protein
MLQFSLILNAVLIVALGYLTLLYIGKIQDNDKDFTPDALEDKVADIKEKSAMIKKRLAEEVNDIKEAIKEVGNQIDDIPEAFSTKRKGRKK